MSPPWGTWSRGRRLIMTLTTTRWNSPAILTCSSRQRAARCCRWGQTGMKRAPLPTTDFPQPTLPLYDQERVRFPSVSDAGGCFQPASRCHLSCHWSAAVNPPANRFRPGLTVLRTAQGMCCVLFLCVGLMGCYGGSCVPQEQSWERRLAWPSISPTIKGSTL